MPSRAIIAVAGSGKTSTIVEEALALAGKRILMTTYTNENLAQIQDYFALRHGCTPRNISVQTWYGFLMADGARPYQRSVTGGAPRISGLYFDSVPQSARRWRRTDPGYYLTDAAEVYRDRLADLVVQANQRTNGAVVNRIREIYDAVFVDEMQDLAGPDLDILEALMRAGVDVVCVGDPRQSTFRTNNALRNRKYRGAAIVDWLDTCAAAGLLTIEERNECFRCVQEICDFANGLYPDLPAAVSRNGTRAEDSGIRFVAPDAVLEYYAKWKPTVLRHDRRRDTLGLPAKNFGEVKGRTYERVLIFPTQPMVSYIETGKADPHTDVSKFYVAVTRARVGVAFVKEPAKRRSRARNE